MGVDDGHVLWVVGGGSGMGRAAALAAGRSGRAVVVSGRRAERLEEVVGGIEAGGGTALAVPGDATEDGWARGAVEAVVDRFGRLDEVVLAAGLNAPNRRWDDQSMADAAAIVDVDLVGVVRSIDAALPALRVRGGTVVVVSSYSAWAFNPTAGVAYSAAKSALAQVCRTLNAQEGEHGVRATHLCPGDVDTEFLDRRPVVPDGAARAAMLTPDDVARSVLHVLDAPPHVRIDELVISPLSQR